MLSSLNLTNLLLNLSGLALYLVQLGPSCNSLYQLPCFKKYYWVAVMVTVRWWFAQDRNNPVVNLEAAILGSYSEPSNVVYRSPKNSPQVTIPIKTMVVVWRQVTMYLSDPGTISPHTPLWDKPCLAHFCSIPYPQIWARYKVRTLRHIMSDGHLLSFVEIKCQFLFTPWMYFRYLQLRHAVWAQFPDLVVLATHFVESLLTARNMDRTLSSIYLRLTCKATSQNFQAWQCDIPTLTEEDWNEGLQHYIQLMISARDRFAQLKFLHGVCYTPQRLSVK